MDGRLAILACSGALPLQIAAAHPDAIRIGFAGIPNELTDTQEHRIEKFGALFSALRKQGVERIVLAGSLSRPVLDPGQFDPTTAALASRLMIAMRGGDDTLLSEVIRMFEEHGFKVLGAHELLPELVAETDVQVGPALGQSELEDTKRAQAILSALSPLDVGQGCAVAQGQCLGIETLQGTDALLRFVAETPKSFRPVAGGVYVKAAKKGQDLRVDMPAIGPHTIHAVSRARLAGLVVEAGKVMILDRAKTIEAVCETGIFLSVRKF